MTRNFVLGVLLVWMGIASSAQAANMYFIHSDHLGTPQALSDEQGDVVWRGVYSPFGELVASEGVIEPPLRFPGQYADQETGLYYNYFRDYDPTVGRYVQSDPIGLDGGINTYGYALQNPVLLSDPDGLNPVVAGIAACAASYACISAAGASIYVVAQSAGEIVNAAVDACNTASEPLPGAPSGDPRCGDLNRRVQETKKPIQAFGAGRAACRSGMSIYQLEQRKTAWLDHARARAQSGQVCWNGGDEGHQQAQADAWKHVSNCSSLLR